MSFARVIAASLSMIAVGWCMASVQAGDAGAFLTQRGLVQHQKNWLLPAEVAMQRRIRGLPKLESELVASQTSARRLAESLLAASAQAQRHLQAAENNIRVLEARRAGLRSERQRKIVDALIQPEREKIKRLREVWVEPDQVAGLPAMRQAVIHLTNARNDMAATILWIHDTRPVLRDEYAKLAEDAEVRAALHRAGSDHQLGTGEDYDAKPFLRMLAGYEKHVFTDELPLYRDKDELRVAAFINRTPVTFTWHTSEEPVMLTASVIEASGLTVPADAPQMKWRFADGKQLSVRQFEIPYVRFGRHVLSNVTAFALPPEGEQYGAHIGPAAFEGHSPRAEPEKMRLVIR